MFQTRSDVRAALALVATVCAASAASADDAKARLPVSVPAVQAGATKLEVKNVIGLVGQTITLEAALTRVDGGGPVAGRSVSFRVKGAPGGDVAAGSGQTDGSGRAKVSFKVPEIKQGSYDLAALSLSETPAAGPTASTAKIGIFKAETSLSLAEASHETSTRGHGPAPEGARGHQWVAYNLTRKTDGGKVVGRPLRVTLDGKALDGQRSGTDLRLPDVPNVPALLAAPWTVEARFEGDDCYQSTAPARLVVKKKP